MVKRKQAVAATITLVRTWTTQQRHDAALQQQWNRGQNCCSSQRQYDNTDVISAAVGSSCGNNVIRPVPG